MSQDPLTVPVSAAHSLLVDVSNDAVTQWAERGWEMIPDGYRVCFWSDKNIIKLDCDDSFTGLKKKTTKLCE